MWEYFDPAVIFTGHILITGSIHYDYRLRDSAYCWCDNLTMAAGANGFMHRFYVIELTINQWDKNNPKNANLVRDDVCDKRPIFANEFGKIFIRRNGYVREVFEKHLGNLKQVTYSGVHKRSDAYSSLLSKAELFNMA